MAAALHMATTILQVGYTSLAALITLAVSTRAMVLTRINTIIDIEVMAPSHRPVAPVISAVTAIYQAVAVLQPTVALPVISSSYLKLTGRFASHSPTASATHGAGQLLFR